MINTGQVLKNNLFKTVCVITSTYDDDDSEVFCSIIHTNGTVEDWVSEDRINKYFTLLAEYPTWREAVNSSEFVDEDDAESKA